VGSFAAEIGYTVRRLALDGSADGWCDAGRMEIVVNQRLAGNAQVRVLVPRARARLGDRLRRPRTRAGGGDGRLTYIVCGQLGLDPEGAVPDTGELVIGLVIAC
jgi:hypothetical protein